MQLVHKLLSTRGGTLIVSGIAAVLAAVILIGYLHRYRESVNSASQPVTVLVAKGLIEKGTPGAVVGTQDLFQTTTAPRDEVKEGAISDPASLRGRVIETIDHDGWRVEQVELVQDHHLSAALDRRE